MTRTLWITWSALWLWVAATMTLVAQDATLPIPEHQVIPLPSFQSSLLIGGSEVTRLHYSPLDRRIFLFPLLTAQGTSLTRMGHPHDPWGHSHHNSLWISHANLNDVDFWSDRGKESGKIALQQIPREAFDETDASCSMRLIAQWQSDSNGKVQLIENRRVTVVSIDSTKSWLLILDSSFSVPKDVEKSVFGATPFGLAAVRMATTIGVHDGKGQILNSNGERNEKEVFRKPATWCDYSGRLTNQPNGLAGITLMNHPSNPSHPTPFHVRDDGWMGACLNLDSPIVVTPDRPLNVRYGFWIHDGQPTRTEVESQFQFFAGLAIPKF